MRLWRRNEAPVGGWYYIMDDGGRVPIRGTVESLEKLVNEVSVRMEAAGLTEPEYLFELVEDQICTRQPEGKCRYTKKAGDMLSAAISMGAKAVDGVLGTTFHKKARTCGSCGRRRVRMNQM